MTFVAEGAAAARGTAAFRDVIGYGWQLAKPVRQSVPLIPDRDGVPTGRKTS
jgi:hypothetical protein